MDYFYPADQQRLFTNRVEELGDLKRGLNAWQDGRGEHVALFGPRRMGKTLLLKELMRQMLAGEEQINHE